MAGALRGGHPPDSILPMQRPVKHRRVRGRR